jgi:hypothetical protein
VGWMGPSKYHPLEAELVRMRELESMVNEHVAEVNEVIGAYRPRVTLLALGV